MNITLELQELDDLIVEHTKPPVTTMLRNKLHRVREQLEAYVAQKQTESAKSEELVPHRGALFRRKPGGGYFDDVLCRKCQQPMVSRHPLVPYRCSSCHITVNIKESHLSQVMKELPT